MDGTALDEALRRTLHVGNVPRCVHRATLLALFQPFGAIEDIRVAGVADQETRYWFVQFAQKGEAVQALALDGTLLHDARVRVSFAKTAKAKKEPSPFTLHLGIESQQRSNPRSRSTDLEKIARTVFVEGIEVEYTALEIARFFAYCGTVTAVRRSPVRSNPSKNRVWVEFMAPSEALRAISCSGQYFDQLLLSIHRSETAICTNELIEPVKYVQETGVFHEIVKRSALKRFGFHASPNGVMHY